MRNSNAKHLITLSQRNVGEEEQKLLPTAKFKLIILVSARPTEIRALESAAIEIR
jgi:hypothetical protein